MQYNGDDGQGFRGSKNDYMGVVSVQVSYVVSGKGQGQPMDKDDKNKQQTDWF